VNRPLTARRRQVLAALRGETNRLPLDPSLAGGLREWLEDGIWEAATRLPADRRPLVVHAGTLRAALGDSSPLTPVEWTAGRALGVLGGALWRQICVTGRVGDPWADSCSAVRAHAPGGLGTFLCSLQVDRRTELQARLRADARALDAAWPPIPAHWHPRTSDRVYVPLAGGAVVLAATLDLVLGAPPAGARSTCVLQVRRTPGPVHRADLRFKALLETIRSGAPPRRAGTFYTARGDVEVADVDDATLAETVQQVIAAVTRLCAPPRTP